MHVQSFEIVNRAESEKMIIEKKVRKEVKHGIPYAARKLTYMSHHSN